MEERILKAEQIMAYGRYLRSEERAGATVEKYLRSVRQFAAWREDGAVTKEAVTGWKEHLLAQGKAPATINAALAALNGRFRYLGWEDCRARFLKIQRRVFRDARRELTRFDYDRLITTARELGKHRLALLMEAICATGIRVSEVQFLTVEAARTGRAEVSLKGKTRVILIPGSLRKKLLVYAKQNKTTSGAIFRTRNGSPISRKQIWAEMKSLCQKAGVAPTKVFPHNLRHLFARVYYNQYHDVAKLADVLGHSSLDTTRIYLISTGQEHQRQLERLGLVS